MTRWRRRWYIGHIHIGYLQVTLSWDTHTWAFGVWMNRHDFTVAAGYLFLDVC